MIPGDAPGMRIEVVGRAEPAGAPLTSPVRGEPCVWWRREHLERRVVTAGGRREEVWRTVAGETSPGALRVRDATGVVPLDASGAEVDPGPQAGERSRPLPGDAVTVRRGRHGDEDVVVGHLEREWVIRPGAPLCVIGGAVPGRLGGEPGIGPPREGAFVVSVREEGALAEDARWRRLLIGGAAVPVALAGAAALVIGLALLSR
ncbi:MAG: E3 ubiquitin ligase family protein [Thermoleophilia bacterium]|nr:E3 ubiquitin ligase family protein [Thermoleophilia bacterium]